MNSIFSVLIYTMYFPTLAESSVTDYTILSLRIFFLLVNV